MATKPGELTPVDFVMRSGDDQIIEVTVKDESDVVVDLTGAAAIKWGLYDGPVLGVEQAVKTVGSGVTIVDAANGRFDIAIDPADTSSLEGRFHHEAEITDSASKIRTVMVGTATIKRDRVNAQTIQT